MEYRAPIDPAAEAGKLFEELVWTSEKYKELGKMSCTIYDTAWVAMVGKEKEDRWEWLFPQSFRHILESQLASGGWERYACEIDEILNTAAGLLCLLKHRAHPQWLPLLNPLDLDQRIAKAHAALASQLVCWNVAQTDHSGFEILVPAMLDYLAKDGFFFDFPGRANLFKVKNAKLGKLQMSWLYNTSDVAPTVIYSLEGLIGVVDFDRVQHRKVCGSMMYSPASTAASLMHSSVWDPNAEAYLTRAITQGAGDSKGFASAYPSTYYEMSWVRPFQRLI
jgi:hypothetical protein